MIQATIPYISGQEPIESQLKSVTPADEFCDSCRSKLNINRIYLNGKKFCPRCYHEQINKQNNIQNGWCCPRCFTIHNPQKMSCDCPATTVTITCTANDLQTR